MKEIRFNEISLLPGLDRINLAKFRYRILSFSWHSLPVEIGIASPVVKRGIRLRPAKKLYYATTYSLCITIYI